MIDPNAIRSILTVDALRREMDYGAIHPEDRPNIDDGALADILAGTPDKFKAIAHYALCWGVGDDCYRVDLVYSAPEDLRKNLRWVVDQFEGDDMDAWLAGPEADGPEFSKAYLAFTCMLMAADEADFRPAIE